MIKQSTNEGIAVTYYHSVGDHPQSRPKSFLSLPFELFEQQMTRLLERRFRTVTLQDLHDYVAGKRARSGPEVVLTFDDGYLDNWVYVWPLAKKLGFKFTVFVNPEFVDPRDIVRPTLEEAWAGKVAEKDLEWWGYLSWPEMRLMEKSGLVDIQSHALTHTWYPTDPQVIDFHHPGDNYHWLVWNAFPDTKPFFLANYDETKVPYGTPVQRFTKSIEAKRYFPDQRAADYLAGHVAANGGQDFFNRQRWREELRGLLKHFQESSSEQGRFETETEHLARIRHEVAESKRSIESALGKEVRFLCWPGGAETALARRLALEAGYWGTTKGTALNRPGNDPSHIWRVSPWFGAPLPYSFKWRLFDGQMDRARGVSSLFGLAARALAAGRRVMS